MMRISLSPGCMQAYLRRTWWDYRVANKEHRAGCEGIPGQGPFMVVVVELEDDRIQDAKFQTYGCPVAIACGEFVCNWAQGKSAKEVDQLTEDHVVVGVGHPPLGREHCPGLAVRALKKAFLADLSGTSRLPIA
jgi:NifU-like protein involved in Fe-S cluster formation